MIERNDDGTYTGRRGDLSTFLSIVEEQYKVYSDFIHKRSNVDELQGEEVIRLNQTQIDPLYICTIFSALFLEAYIYDYCARKKSSSLAKSLDKLDPPNKWIIGTALCNLVGIDAGKEAHENVKKLFKYRNSLAHNKSKKHELGNQGSEQNNPNILKPIECINIITALLEELVVIDNSETYAPIVIEKMNKLKSEYPA